MDSEDSRGLRQVAVAVGKDALNVFPFNTGERLCRGFGRLLCRGAIERRHNLVRIDRLGQIARGVQPCPAESCRQASGLTVFAFTDEDIAVSRVVCAGVTIPRIRVHP